MTGSDSRCQPSRHWAARRVLARSAHAGHTTARVCPHGTRICSTAPVPGRCGATAPGGCRRRAQRPGPGRLPGPAASPAVRPGWSCGCRSGSPLTPVQVVVGKWQGVAAYAAFEVHAVQTFEQERTSAAQGGRVRRCARSGPPLPLTARHQRGHVLDVGVGDVAGAGPHGVGGGFQPHVGHPGADLGQRPSLGPARARRGFGACGKTGKTGILGARLGSCASFRAGYQTSGTRRLW